MEEVSRDQRAIGKTVNFATIYGQSGFGLSKQLGVTPEEARDYIDRYFALYPRVLQYRDEILEQARKTGMVSTLFGRRRQVPDISNPNKMVSQAAERVAFNTVFQGTAADIIKKAMIEIDKQLPQISDKTRMLLQVHDELIFEVPENEIETVRPKITEIMQNAATLDVPLIVDSGVGKNWQEAH